MICAGFGIQAGFTPATQFRAVSERQLLTPLRGRCGCAGRDPVYWSALPHRGPSAEPVPRPAAPCDRRAFQNPMKAVWFATPPPRLLEHWAKAHPPKIFGTAHQTMDKATFVPNSVGIFEHRRMGREGGACAGTGADHEPQPQAVAPQMMTRCFSAVRH